MCDVMEFVVIYDVVGKVSKSCHWCVEIKIFDVNGHELGISGRDDIVEVYFDSDHVGCGCTAVPWEVNAIAAGC